MDLFIMAINAPDKRNAKAPEESESISYQKRNHFVLQNNSQTINERIQNCLYNFDFSQSDHLLHDDCNFKQLLNKSIKHNLLQSIMFNIIFIHASKHKAFLQIQSFCDLVANEDDGVLKS